MDVVADMPPGAATCSSALGNITATDMAGLPGDLLVMCAEEGLTGSIEALHHRDPDAAAAVIDLIRDYPQFSAPGLADRLAERIAAM